VRAAKETLILIGRAFGLIWRHWPALLALSFGGFMMRQLMINLAVQASAVHKVFGMLVFALVPLGLLIALVLMLRTVRPSLPSVATLLGAAGPRGSGMFQVASVLVPFLFVYSAFDYFIDDRAAYYYRVWEDESLNNASLFSGGTTHMADRLIFGLDKTVLISVGIAVSLRWLIGLWRSARGYAFVGFTTAYLEVVWMTLAALTFTLAQNELVKSRVAYVWADDHWKTLLGSLGPASGAAKFVSDALGAADLVIVVPVAWLAVAAIVYGRSVPEGADLLPPPARRHWLRMPRALRSDVSDSFGPLARGLRLLRHVGLAPMLLFCVVFVLAQSVPDAFWFAERALIGPQDLKTVWWPLSYLLAGFNDSVGAMVLVCLVAVAVDRVLGLREASRAGEAAESARDGQPGVGGIVGGVVDPHRGGPHTGGRDEESRGLVPA
jgi:hypothetical protein